MNEELLSLAKEQIPKLPESILKVFQDPQTTTKVSELAQSVNLNTNQASKLDLEVTLLLLGLTNPQSFSVILEKQLGVNREILDRVVQTLEDNILNPIYADLMRFYDADQKLLKEISSTPDVNSSEQTPATPATKPVLKKMPDVAPENLPVESALEDQPDFLPNLTPKIPVAGKELEIPPQTEPAHPFEEKMQKVFTGGAPAMDTLKIEETQNQKPALDVNRIKHDPYREPIEL